MAWKNFIKEKIANTAGRMLQRVTWKKLPQNLTEWQSANVSYSQFAEDILINTLLTHFHLSDSAYYVDIGACDPVYLSNTLRLHQTGWMGINVDPNPENIAKFKIQRPNDINLEIAVSQMENEAEFIIYDSKTTGSLAVNAGSSLKNILGENPQRKIKVKTMPLRLMLEKYSPTDRCFGFINIDCEGEDLVVLHSNDWMRFRPWIVAVEDHSLLPETEISRFMINQDYILLSQAFITKFFIRKDIYTKNL
ncbi:FkbM family methyltransferase [Nodularia sp. UHCC 0506]|uniref:FkbM family methyltransferase n=1 Tax=Nodularia sp. UHCC 0506 TaxID=3110243 RepID=UPI002B21A1BB|nr:FkbM family methyltransferase [Nodularia sp. UHCC 0506]MEA5516181.1 FkbM family methyltransferase [Nodularia sp. UHCC 0506]